MSALTLEAVSPAGSLHASAQPVLAACRAQVHQIVICML